MVWLSIPYPFKFFKRRLPQFFCVQFLNTSNTWSILKNVLFLKYVHFSDTCLSYQKRKTLIPVKHRHHLFDMIGIFIGERLAMVSSSHVSKNIVLFFMFQF